MGFKEWATIAYIEPVGQTVQDIFNGSLIWVMTKFVAETGDINILVLNARGEGVVNGRLRARVGIGRRWCRRMRWRSDPQIHRGSSSGLETGDRPSRTYRHLVGPISSSRVDVVLLIGEGWDVGSETGKWWEGPRVAWVGGLEHVVPIASTAEGTRGGEHLAMPVCLRSSV